MSGFTLEPKNPFTNLAISVLVGSSVATVLYTGYMFLRMEELGFTTSHVVFGGLAMLFMAPAYIGVIALFLISPLLWLAKKTGYAGPLVAITVGCVPVLGLLWYDISIALYPITILVVFVLLAYPSFVRSGLKNNDV